MKRAVDPSPTNSRKPCRRTVPSVAQSVKDVNCAPAPRRASTVPMWSEEAVKPSTAQVWLSVLPSATAKTSA